MTTDVNEIKIAIRGLHRSDVKVLQQWLEKYAADQWDEQIEQDIRAGKLDKLLKKAEEDHRAGHSREL